MESKILIRNIAPQESTNVCYSKPWLLTAKRFHLHWRFTFNCFSTSVLLRKGRSRLWTCHGSLWLLTLYERCICQLANVDKTLKTHLQRLQLSFWTLLALESFLPYIFRWNLTKSNHHPSKLNEVIHVAVKKLNKKKCVLSSYVFHDLLKSDLETCCDSNVKWCQASHWIDFSYLTRWSEKWPWNWFSQSKHDVSY